MRSGFVDFLAGALCGVFLAGVAAATVDGPFKTAKIEIAECERSLPRDQRCVIVAVPEKP